MSPLLSPKPDTDVLLADPDVPPVHIEEHERGQYSALVTVTIGSLTFEHRLRLSPAWESVILPQLEALWTEVADEVAQLLEQSGASLHRIDLEQGPMQATFTYTPGQQQSHLAVRHYASDASATDPSHRSLRQSHHHHHPLPEDLLSSEQRRALDLLHPHSKRECVPLLRHEAILDHVRTAVSTALRSWLAQ